VNALEKGTSFCALHHRNRAFLIPNPWDVGTARILAHCGFEALATTSAGFAFSRGRGDGTVNRNEVIDHVSEIVRATDLPVSADLENGYGETLEAVAETFRLAAAGGVVGGSIEDATGLKEGSVFDQVEAAERVQAAAETVRSLPFPFMLTARAENYLCGRPDLPDTIKRLQAYQEAGADVLYAPGVTKKEDIAAILQSVDRPVNVLMGLRGAQLSLAELSELGVKRISVGSALNRAALGALLNAVREMQGSGTFSFADEAVSYQDINAIFKP
jgi:2-methylisocitrate lyase-like PEP mutase family enzyme